MIAAGDTTPNDTTPTGGPPGWNRHLQTLAEKAAADATAKTTPASGVTDTVSQTYLTALGALLGGGGVKNKDTSPYVILPQQSSGGPNVMALLVLLAVIGGGAWWFMHRKKGA